MTIPAIPNDGSDHQRHIDIDGLTGWDEFWWGKLPFRLGIHFVKKTVRKQFGVDLTFKMPDGSLWKLDPLGAVSRFHR